MYTPADDAFFAENGYLHLPGILTGEELTHIQSEFDRVWDLPGQNNQHKLLQHETFIALIEQPAILAWHRRVFHDQLQLLQYDFLRQVPGSTFPDRVWHRDFVFPGDNPLTINTILYLDDMDEERGPTYVVPNTHRGERQPPGDKRCEPLPGEVAMFAKAGDAAVINSAIWHSGSRNKSATQKRRAIYLYYGYWWLKRFESETTLPWQALQGASQQRLELLGVKMPHPSIHEYTVATG